MKKYVILFLISIFIITAIVLSGTIINAAEQVNVYTLKSFDAERTLNASGRLQYESLKNIYSENYGLIEAIYVKSGDEVKKGDELLSLYEFSTQDSFPYSSGEIDKLITAFNSGLLGDDITDTIKKYALQKTIYADADGRVSSISCMENEIVQQKAVLMKLVDPAKLTIPLNINESDIEKISIGQKVRISFTAVEDKKYSGSVTDIAKEAKQTTGLVGKETSVEVTVTMDESDDRLKPGYSAECIIIISLDKDRLILPYEYLNQDSSGEYVFIVKHGRARKQYIKTGEDYSSGAEILEGLIPGDKIITDKKELSDDDRIVIDNED